jgi:XTP/dITP diphosphohydrolase
MQRIRFLSSNPNKIAEATSILKTADIEVVAVDMKIEEIQTPDELALVRDKCLKAAHKIGRPLFVEHTGLYLSVLNSFPGGLTQIFWDTLKEERVAELFGSDSHPVTAKTTIAYCDGRKIFVFTGEIEGRIASKPRGDRTFQWDCVFVPNGFKETFAELGAKKNEISMRRIALDKFAEFIKKARDAR